MDFGEISKDLKYASIVTGGCFNCHMGMLPLSQGMLPLSQGMLPLSQGMLQLSKGTLFSQIN